MPTNNKKTVSLKNEDLIIIQDLREPIERKDRRYSQAEIIRLCLQYCLKHQVEFNKDFF